MHIPQGGTIKEKLEQPKHRWEGFSLTAAAMEQHIDSLDFKKLENVFARRLKKYGAEKNISNFVARDKIRVLRSLDSEGAYDPWQKEIFVGNSRLREMGYDASQKESKEFELLALEVVAHEEAHAVSHTAHILEEDDASFSLHAASGLQQTKVEGQKENLQDFVLAKMKSETYMEFLNEGITEKFSKRIVEDYLAEENPLSEDDKQKIWSRRTYKLNINFFDLLCTVIGQYTDNSPETIEEAFYASYFQGEDFMSEEMKGYFDDQIINGFSNILLMKKENAKAYIEKVLAHLNTEN